MCKQQLRLQGLLVLMLHNRSTRNWNNLVLVVPMETAMEIQSGISKDFFVDQTAFAWKPTGYS